MPTAAEFTGFLAPLFPEASMDLLALDASAAENAGLLRSDFYTLRDLLDLSGHGDQEPLHVLLLCLLLALDEGSLCVEATEAGLARRLAGLTTDADARRFARLAGAGLNDHGYPGLIGAEADGKPVVRCTTAGKPYLYFQKYRKYEQELRAQLQRRLAAPPPIVDLARAAAVWQEVLVAPAGPTPGRPVVLNRAQQLAVALGMLRRFAVISGGPGTGKTSIVFTLLRCLLRLGIAPERIALAAPTGRAAQRLTDAVRAGVASLGAADADGPDAALRDITASTLHQLLGYHPGRGTFRQHVENPVPADVIVVDEVSMVGLVLMSQLLQATDAGTRLILLGDKDQLPSVEAGAVLANLVPAASTPSFSAALRKCVRAVCPGLKLAAARQPHPLEDALVVLEQNYRSERAIQDVAGAINRQEPGATDQLRPLTSLANPAAVRGCWLLDLTGTGPGHWRRVLEQWQERQYLTAAPAGATYRALVEACLLPAGEVGAEHHPLLDRLFALLGRARVLTLVREGPHGCVGINQFLEQMLRPRLDARSRHRLFRGAPVLVTRNDYRRGLFNGDVGITLAAPTGCRVVFPRQGGYVSFPAEALPAHELAFALTVHKSQGSEYGQVLLVLPPEGGRRLLTCEMVYTGITRAKDLAVIAAPLEVLRLAIARRVEREAVLLDNAGTPDVPSAAVRRKNCLPK